MAVISFSVSGDFSDLRRGDHVTTPAIVGRNVAANTARTIEVPGVVLESTSRGVLILYPHLAQAGLVSNREAVTLVRRGGQRAVYSALREYSNGLTIGGFAAIGSDGTREVVWGLGDTGLEAREDARENAREDGCEPEISRVVPVTGAQAARILAGDVSADSLEVKA